MKKIGFVILNYCTWAETFRCVEAIKSNVKQYECCICVVDNNSPEKASDTLLSQIESIVDVIIFHNKNDGYNAGNNIGLDYLLHIDCDYYVIVNSDVIIKESSLEKMIEVAENDKGIGIVGPRVIEHGKESFNGCNRRVTLTDIYFSTTVLGTFFKKRNKKLHHYEYQSDKHYIKVFSVSGCCFLMTNNCCRAIYPLDASRKLYNEENMLGIKMERLGYYTVIAYDAIIDHLHGASTSKDPANAYIERMRSDFYYIDNYLSESKIRAYPLYLIRKSVFKIKSRKDKNFNPNKRTVPGYSSIYK